VWHIEILASGFRTDKAMAQAEIKFIKKFNSFGKGYNSSPGGESGHRPGGWRWSKAHRKRISEMRKKIVGWKHSLKTRRKIAKSHIGIRPSEVTRRKLSRVSKIKILARKRGADGRLLPGK